MHLHAWVTDGVFVPAAVHAGCDAPPTFLPARPVIAADLAALTERVSRRVIRWFRMQRLLDATAAADMLAWENSTSASGAVPWLAGMRQADNPRKAAATLMQSPARTTPPGLRGRS